MDERIVRFISSLRASGVRVSLAESADAFQAVEIMGARNREIFRLSLQATLVKEARDLRTFNDLFPLFFDQSNPSPLLDVGNDLSSKEAHMLAEALEQFTDHLRRTMQRLMGGHTLERDDLERLAQLVGLNHSVNLRHREWMVQRMQRALGFREVRDTLQKLSELLESMGMNRQRIAQIRRLVLENQQALENQLRHFAGQRIAENLSQKPPDEGADYLLDRPFHALSDRDKERLRQEVTRLASVLRTRVALRQKRARNGQLDAKATIRTNLKHGAIPVEIRHRDRILKPKLVVICDVSTSMRFCSELMLSLIYALQDQISKTQAFAFIDHLENISPDFRGTEIEKAVARVLDRLPSGYFNTDLGASLDNFVHDYLGTLDHRTTLIVVGDGRNNYNDPRIDLFSLLARRCRRSLWLNPEPEIMWGTGDSDMLYYAPECDVILQVSNLAELSAAVDKLLSH